MNQYLYKVSRIEKVVDGDTIYVQIDLGFRVKYSAKIRLANVDAPEIYRGDADEKARGHIVKERDHILITKLFQEHDIYIKSKKTGKYGRWIGTFFYLQDKVPVNINDEINKIINEVNGK